HLPPGLGKAISLQCIHWTAMTNEKCRHPVTHNCLLQSTEEYRAAPCPVSHKSHIFAHTLIHSILHHKPVAIASSRWHPAGLGACTIMTLRMYARQTALCPRDGSTALTPRATRERTAGRCSAALPSNPTKL